MNELNPLTLGDTPDDLIELEDGSVEIPSMKAVEPEDSEFLQNLAETLSEDELYNVASELVELVEKDKKSREKRDKQYEEGLRRTGLGDDAPGGAEFDGASRVVHPVLAEACVDFSSRAIKELFPATGPVRPWIIGDANTEKAQRAQRKTRFMNWQLTTQIQEYRAELEQLLTQLPMGGSQYQKFWYDERLERPKCEFVPVDEIFLPYSATNFYTAQRVTHRQLITKYEFKRRVKNGLYRDVFLTQESQYPEESKTTKANDKIEGREEDGYNEDGLRAILEIYTWQEFTSDDVTDGEYAPYIITIDEDTEEVLSVYRNWKEGDQRLEKLDWFVEWKFIPWRGAYAIGLPHLIGGISAALTGALRALLDSAHINNAPTMLKLKAGRLVGQNTQVNVTQVCDIEGPAGIDDIRKMAMSMPFNPPSPVLAQLMGDLYGLAKGVIATADDRIAQVGDRTPVGTTMALVEQGSTTYSAIHARLHESQKKALEIIHRINSEYLDDDSQFLAVEGEYISRDDFTGSMDVIPVSDPAIFSESQRFAQTQAMIQLAQADTQNPNIPWNQVNIRRRALKQMRIENIDELLPAPETPLTADVATENFTARQGKPVKAAMEQDHLAHLKGHLAYFSNPMIVQNPLIPPPVINAMLGHINEHLGMYEAVTIQKTKEQLTQQYLMQGQQIPEEMLCGMAIMQAMQAMSQDLVPMMQTVGQMQQQLQQRTPPQPLPPEVQATKDIGMAEVERKKMLDQATLQLKGGEQQAKQAAEAAKFQADQAATQFEQQMAAAQQQFDQYMEQLQVQNEQQAKSLAHQVEIMKNEQDNHQKQMTELLKNRDDNDTKMAIAQLTEQFKSMQTSLTEKPEQAPDLTPHLKQLQMMLDQIGKSQTNDALGEVINGLRVTMEHLSKPKMLIKDQQGRTVGIQSV